MSVTRKSTIVVAGGTLFRCSHTSTVCKSTMNFSVFMPPSAALSSNTQTPAMFWLSGLTCSDENFVTKASNAFTKASELGIAIVVCDTSPRENRVENDDKNWDFGIGAGFYVDAIQAPYSTAGYNMYSYVTTELPAVVAKEFKAGGAAKSIAGHSMGGHGALTIALKNPAEWAAVSAFAPVANPSKTSWGTKAFEGYLGGSAAIAEAHDATCLLASHHKDSFDEILIDQGAADSFLNHEGARSGFPVDELQVQATLLKRS